MKCPQCGTNNRDNARFCLGCGRRLSPAKSAVATAPEQAQARPKKRRVYSPQTIQKGRYLVIQKLGSGGMSRVYLARDTKMDFNVVVKEMFPPKSYPEKKVYFLKKFKNEAKLLFRLRHPGIPRVTDYFAEGDSYYMVMEYIEGENIDNIVKSRSNNKINIDEFFNWFGRVLTIIKFLHNQNPPIFHRDIKPANIMLDAHSNIYLADFGVAKAMSLKEAHTRIGTIGYASPEHFTGKFVNSSDLYSLGATFHYLLSGDDPRYRLPFDFPPLSVYREDLPDGVEEMMLRMLDKEARNRYPSVEHLEKDFSDIENRYREMTAKTAKETPKAAPAKDHEQAKVEVEQTREEEAVEEQLVSPRKSGRLNLPIFKRIRRTSRQALTKSSKPEGEESVEGEIPKTPVAPVSMSKPGEVKPPAVPGKVEAPAVQEQPARTEEAPAPPVMAAEPIPPVEVKKPPAPAPRQESKAVSPSPPLSPLEAARKKIEMREQEAKRLEERQGGEKRSLFSPRAAHGPKASSTPSPANKQGMMPQAIVNRAKIEASKLEEAVEAEAEAPRAGTVAPAAPYKPSLAKPQIGFRSLPRDFGKSDLPSRPGEKPKKGAQKNADADQDKEEEGFREIQEEPPSEDKVAPKMPHPASSVPGKGKNWIKYKDESSFGKILEAVQKNMFLVFLIVLLGVVIAFTLYVLHKYMGDKNRRLKPTPAVTAPAENTPAEEPSSLDAAKPETHSVKQPANQEASKEKKQPVKEDKKNTVMIKPPPSRGISFC